jgi:transcriptional antiterminator RfaH
MPSETETSAPWYCIRSQPGRQNVAAAHLRTFSVETFNPQLRRRAATRAGIFVRAEPLFPNYLFARFDFETQHRRVRYAIGVSTIISFGGACTMIDPAEIARLRRAWGPGESLILPQPVAPGDRVALSGPLFHGMTAEVLCLLPARQRVRVLLDFLGGPHHAEIAESEIVPVLSHPLTA